jgi:phage gpG-like protein
VARFSVLRRGGQGGRSRKGVDIRFDALDDAIEKLLEAGAGVGDEVRPVVAEILVAEVQEAFAKEGAVGGNPAWPRFYWERQGLPRPHGRRWQGELKLLQDTGVLVSSITPYSEAGFAEAFTNVAYAGYHVSQRPRHKIPLRDFTQIDFDKALTETVEVILAQLDANANAA